MLVGASASSLLALGTLQVLSLVLNVHAGRDFYSGVSSVVRISKYNFAGKTSSPNLPLLLEFYSPSCGYCQRLESDWEKLAKHTEGHVQVGATNCQDALDDLCSRYQIRTVPNIKLFLRNDAGETYFKDYPTNLGHSFAEILGWLVESLPSALVKVSETRKGEKVLKLDEFIRRDPSKAHLLLVRKSGWLESMASKTLSMQFKDKFVMGILDETTDGAAVRKRFDLDQSFAKDADGLLIIRNGKAKVYKGERRFTELKAFMSKLSNEETDDSTLTNRLTEL